MAMFETLAKRRSCRRFDGREIPEDDLKKIALAATLSPSGLGKNELSFVCVEGNKAQQYLDLMMKIQGNDPYFGGRSFIFVVRNREKDGLADQDAGAALQTMYLESMDLGYGACVLHLARGVFASEEGQEFQRQVLGLNPEKWQILESMVFGYPLERHEPNTPNEERVYVVK